METSNCNSSKQNLSKLPPGTVLLTVFLLILFTGTLFRYIYYQLRKKFPIRVNCWFCNKNTWIGFTEKNSWICKSCDQYNGFTKDGDYNIPPDTRTFRTVKYTKTSTCLPLSNNGLCRRCNENQCLKIARLREFVPLHEKNFNTEVDDFRNHLENIYQLCKPCKKYLKFKLSSESKLHLTTKLLNNRQKSSLIESCSQNSQDNIIKITLRIVTFALIVSIVSNIILYLNKLYKIASFLRNYFFNQNIPENFYSIPVSSNNLLNMTRSIESVIISMIPYNSYLPFSLFQEICDYYKLCNINYVKIFDLPHLIYIFSISGFSLQIVTHICDFNLSFKHFVNDLVWSLVIYSVKAQINYSQLLQIFLVIVLIFNTSWKTTKPLKFENKIKNKNSTNKNIYEENDSDHLDGNESDSNLNHCYNPSPTSYRMSLSPTLSRYYKPDKLFFNSPSYKSNINPSYFPNYKYLNPYVSSTSFENNHKLFSSELDKRINSLNLGNHKRKKNNSFTVNPNLQNCFGTNLFSYSSNNYKKPILSPSRLSCGTQQSWVAGGYWGSDSPSKLFTSNGISSSSSQSSGFESFTSRNINSFPPSRENSICSEVEKSEIFESVSPSHSSYNNSNFSAFTNFGQNLSASLPHVP